MKTLFLGDIHGHEKWKRIVDLENPDKVIFIGDYFDSQIVPWDKQVANFLDIIEFKKNSGKEVITLLGNHDYHYLEVNDYGTYSGFQPKVATHITQVLKEHIKELQIAHIHKEVFLCTHAGITNTFCHLQGIDTNDIENELNDLFIFKPNRFGFNGMEPSGDDVTQGPLWVREESLLSDILDKDYMQVVGHTQVLSIRIRENLIMIDALEQGMYFIEDGDLAFKTLDDDNI